MDMCLLCLELKKETTEGIKVTSTQWQEENMEHLIEKHFWALKSITSNSWLCTTCWGILNEFHKFYTRIEDAHLYFVSMLKTELLECNEDIETVMENDLSTLNTNLLDSPYAKGQAGNHDEDEDEKPIAIKTEIITDEQPLPADIEFPPKTRLKRRDPLERPTLHVKNRKVRKVDKSCNKTRETTVEERLEEEEVEKKENTTNDKQNIAEYPSSPTDFVVDDNNSDSDSDNDSDNGETSPPVDWKPRSNPYYKPRTNRRELDEFLAKHYNITCIICQAPMQTFHELCKHFTKQHKERGYVICCNKKFLKVSLLVDHIHCHLDPEHFKCKNCGKIMSDRRCLEVHVKTHEAQDKPHICDICDKGFSRRSGLRNHKLIHLTDDEKKFACEQCGKLFGNNNLLANHVRVVHMNKYALVCDVCGEKMRGKDVFERHILKHKGVPVPTIACDVCGLKVTGQRGLKRHKDSQHPEGGKQDYPCHICSQISPTLKAHKKHVKDKHELGYDFKCTMCEKAYKRSSTLTEHMATHTGTVLYTCPYCPKTFNSNANMHSHRKKAHPKEWEEECRAKYSGNLPPKYKPTVANEAENNNATTMKWY